MAIIRRQLKLVVTGSLGDKDDWWRLCYDTDAREFFIEHEWSHMNGYNVASPAVEGSERKSAEGYGGPGSEKLEQAKQELLAQAGHA